MASILWVDTTDFSSSDLQADTPMRMDNETASNVHAAQRGVLFFIDFLVSFS